MTEKFNYQVVLQFDDDSRLIFAGVTVLSVLELIDSCLAKVIKDLPFFIENVVYQPINFNQNESKEN